MTVVIYAFDVFQLLISQFDKRLLNFLCSFLFCEFTFYAKMRNKGNSSIPLFKTHNLISR